MYIDPSGWQYAANPDFYINPGFTSFSREAFGRKGNGAGVSYSSLMDTYSIYCQLQKKEPTLTYESFLRQIDSPKFNGTIQVVGRQTGTLVMEKNPQDKLGVTKQNTLSELIVIVQTKTVDISNLLSMVVRIEPNSGEGDPPSGSEKKEEVEWTPIQFKNGVLMFETPWEWDGGVTPGPFVIFGRGGSKDEFYSKHEPGHVIQYYLMGGSYYLFVALPSLVSNQFSGLNHSYKPWEKSANQLWFWWSGESYKSNPKLYYYPPK